MEVAAAWEGRKCSREAESLPNSGSGVDMDHHLCVSTRATFRTRSGPPARSALGRARTLWRAAGLASAQGVRQTFLWRSTGFAWSRGPGTSLDRRPPDLLGTRRPATLLWEGRRTCLDREDRRTLLSGGPPDLLRSRRPADFFLPGGPPDLLRTRRTADSSLEVRRICLVQEVPKNGRVDPRCLWRGLQLPLPHLRTLHHSEGIHCRFP